jgi:hypothetical protein
MNTEDMNSPLGARGEERLWDYIDGISSPQEKTVIEQLLENDAEWKAKYSELLEVQQLLHSSELEAPSMRFTKNVMEEIAKLHIAPATKTYINKKIVWGIGIFFITLIVGFLVYGFGQIDWTVQSDTKLPVDFGKVDYSKIFSNTFVNVFMMINVILGLFLLDRFLASKRKKFREEA